MFSRIVSTAVLLLLSVGAFIAPVTYATAGDGGSFIALGVFWLALAALNWFVWQTLRDGWLYGRRAPEGELPLSGWFWPQYFRGAFGVLAPPERRDKEQPD